MTNLTNQPVIGKQPLVGIIMGSTSDLPIMKGAVEILEMLEIPYEMKVISAHRSPHLAFEYASTAEERGLATIIGGAGGAAHLPGVIAALTTLPVIGVPITSKLQGLDSLLSIVQMPSGVPVATMAIDNAKNAALMAARILGIKYPSIATKLKDYAQTLADKVKATTI